MSIKSLSTKIGALILLIITAFTLSLFSMPFTAKAESGFFVGESVTGEAVYTDQLDTGKIDISFDYSLNGDPVLVGLMRSANTVPSVNNSVRGLIFSVRFENGEVLLNVDSVELRSTVNRITDFKIGIFQQGSVDISLVNSESGFRLYINSQRCVNNYNDALSSLNASTFALANKTTLGVNVGDGSEIKFTKIFSTDEVLPESVQWFCKDYVISSSNSVTVNGNVASYSQYLNVAYTMLSLSTQANEVQISFANNVSSPLFDGATASGVTLTIRKLNGKSYADISFIEKGSETPLVYGYLLGTAVDDHTVSLTKSASTIGFRIFVDGIELKNGAYPVLCNYSIADLAKYISGSIYGTYVSVGTQSGEATVTNVSSLEYDPYPAPYEKEIENTSAYGKTSSDWTGNALVNESGVVSAYSPICLNDELSTEYVAFYLGFENLSDSAAVVESSVSFGLASKAQTDSLEMDGSVKSNAIIFTLSMRNGTIGVSGCVRYEGSVKNVLSWIAIEGAVVENDLFIEFVYYDYDIALYINGNMVKTSFGSNPLNDYYSLYFENESYNTYLCFGSSCSQNASKPTLSAENSARYRVYGIANDLPEKYKVKELSVTRSEKAIAEKFEIIIAVLPAVAVVAVFAVCVTVVVLIKKRKVKRNENI